jgi:hypothetical protein
MSPNTGMTEEERRELISRQHRALYGGESNMYTGADAAATTRSISQDARVTAGNVPGAFRTGSGSPYDAFSMPPGGPSNDSGITPRERSNSNSSPNNTSNALTAAFENQQQARTSNSSPGDSPPRDGNVPPTSSAVNVAPIGTRPTGQQQGGGPQPNNLQKRSTTPLPSPLSYGFSAEQGQGEKSVNGQDDNNKPTNNSIRGGWGSSGVWGGKGGLGVQPKVWG